MPVVLVVDDGAANRELLSMYLGSIDCEVRLAADGFTALEMIEKDPPDLVLLDVRMPRMDGYEVCRRIKAMPRGKLLPVVMITGLSQTRHRVAALEAGADDFMTKPVEGTELTARVRSALRLKELYNTLDSAEKIRKFFEAEKYTFLPLLQKDGAISKPYRVEGCPTNYLIGPDGKILERVTGALVEDNLRDFVEHSLPKK